MSNVSKKNVQFKTVLMHEPDCKKWVPHCDHKLIYVDEFVGHIRECEDRRVMGDCEGMKINPLVSCTCEPDITYYWKTPEGKEFHTYKVWYAQSGTIWKCSCGEEDHTGDEPWEVHDCLVRTDPDDEIPF